MAEVVSEKRILKPSLLGLKAGEVLDFVILGSHVEHDNGLLYLPVGVSVCGEMLLNKGRKTAFVEALGHDSDAWVNSRFRAVVVSVLNPETRESVLSFQIIPDSVRAGVC